MTAETRRVSDSSFNPFTVLLVLAGAMALGVAVVAVQEWALYGLFGVMAFAVFVRYPVMGVYVTTVLLLVVSGAAGVLGTLNLGVPVTYAKISGFVTAVAWIIHVLALRAPIRVRIQDGVLAAFFAWSFFGVMFSPHWREQFPEWIRLATVVLFFYISVNVLAKRILLHRYVLLIAFCGLAMSIFALIQYVSPALQYTPEQLREIGAGEVQGAYLDPESLQYGEAARVSGTATHSNWLSFALLIILPLYVYWYVSAKGFTGRFLAVSAAALGIIALILTFTRTGFLVGSAVAVLLILRGLVKISPQRIAALGLLFLVSWFFLPAEYKERVLNFGTYAGSSSIQHRNQLMNEALTMAVQNPMLGVGLGGYGIHLIEQDTEVAIISRWLVDEYDWNPVFLGAHNMYLHVASETGLVGLGLLMLFFFLVFRHLLNAEALFRKAGDRQGVMLCSVLLVSLLSFFICGLLLHGLQQKIWWMIAASAAVAPFIEVYRESPERPSAHIRHVRFTR